MRGRYLHGVVLVASLVSATPVLAQTVFNYGEVLRDAAEIRALEEQTRALEIDNQRRQEEQRRQAASRNASDEQAAEIAQRFSEAIQYRRYRWDDFDEVVFDEELQISLDMVALMAESRYAADIAYYLGKHPEESARISQMPLPEAGKAIFDIEELVVESLE